MDKKISGQLQQLYACYSSDTFVTQSVEKIALGFEGIKDDRHAGMTRKSDARTPWYTRGTDIKNTRQLSLVSTEELETIAQKMEVEAVKAEWLGANMLVSGVSDFTLLPIGSRLFFDNGAVIVIEGENLPCINPAKVIAAHYQNKDLEKRFAKAAKEKRGVVAWVEKEGMVHAPSQFKIMLPRQRLYPGLMG